MPAQWTGDIVGEMHRKNITAERLAVAVGWHPKYLSKVLHSESPPKKAEQKLRAALESIESDASAS